MVTFQNIKKEDLKKLLKFGFSPVKTKTKYETTRLKSKTTTLILFKSGNLLLQGKKEIIEREKELLKKLKIGQQVKPPPFQKTTGTIIGSDESLKGDTFGGLVVAAVKADNQTRKKLLPLGIADSKTLKDEEIITIAKKIQKITACEVKIIYPEEYNKNPHITQLLNQLHQECYNFLKPGKHLVDRFPGCTVGHLIKEKADSKYLEVAAASILARYHALKQFQALSQKAGFPLPRGSTHVQDALIKLKLKKLNPKWFVKLNFKNVKNVFRE